MKVVIEEQQGRISRRRKLLQGRHSGTYTDLVASNT